MSQGPPSTWKHTSRGIIAENGDLVCDAPDPYECTHLECNVGKPKVVTVERLPVVDQQARDENRRAAINLWPPELVQLLQLPKGYWIEQIYAVFDPMSIRVIVGSPDLPPQPHNTYLPDLGRGTLARLRMVDADGVAWTRWEWQPA